MELIRDEKDWEIYLSGLLGKPFRFSKPDVYPCLVETVTKDIDGYGGYSHDHIFCYPQDAKLLLDEITNVRYEPEQNE